MCVQVMLRHGLVFTFSQEGLVGATNLNTLAVHLIAIKVRKNEKNGLFSLSLNGRCIWSYRPDRCYQDRLGTN
jgi:hypothetical protein